MATTKRHLTAKACLAAALALLGAGCGGGGGGSSTVAPPVAPAPPPAPIPPSQGLLTDAQLRTPSDAQAAQFDRANADWFAAESHIIRSLTYDQDFSDLTFLEPALANKRIVMLGESSHGVEEYSQAKLRLIKYLHEQQGYNLLAIEGGLFDCENAQKLVSAGATRAAMLSCLFGVWSTETVLELFKYVAQTQTTSTPLRITGFDVQASGSSADGRASYTASIVNKVDPNYADEVQQLEQDFRRLTADAIGASSFGDAAIRDLTSQLPDLANRYAVLSQFLRSNLSAITADGEFSQREVQIAALYSQTSPAFAEQLSRRFETDGGGYARDAGMATNFIELATQIYPNEKIISWAHNAHLRHAGTGFLPDANMGALVHDVLEDDLYTIGFYMYRGQHTFNDRSVQTVKPPIDFSLEAIFHSRRLAYLFLDIENASTSDSSAQWLEQPTPTWTWGSIQIDLRLKDEYDGVFVIDTVSPPGYIF